MSGWYNVTSLILGLTAWALPIIYLIRSAGKWYSNWAVTAFLSMTACAAALCFQILNVYELVKIEDWSALLDTAGAVAAVSAFLLLYTILLNGVVLFTILRKHGKHSLAASAMKG